jgi:hypothetical protein
MTGRPCDQESAVQSALQAECWTDELREHVAECSDCSDLVLVAGYLRETAASVGDDGELPDPGYIWWRAQLATRAAKVERATRAITIWQRVALACGSLLSAFVLFRTWPQIREWLFALKPDRLSSPLPADMAQPALVIAASLVLLAVMIAYDRYEPRTEK